MRDSALPTILAVFFVICGFMWFYGGPLVDRLINGKYQDRVPIATWTNDTTITKSCD